ncbi:MAG: hypothetical protein C0424_00525 [Sphingobacteriaceae bacterium]|nr:hypothetical protein [Sphingobacteriaceae bacterium]
MFFMGGIWQQDKKLGGLWPVGELRCCGGTLGWGLTLLSLSRGEGRYILERRNLVDDLNWLCALGLEKVPGPEGHFCIVFGCFLDLTLLSLFRQAQ